MNLVTILLTFVYKVCGKAVKIVIQNWLSSVICLYFFYLTPVDLFWLEIGISAWVLISVNWNRKLIETWKVLRFFISILQKISCWVYYQIGLQMVYSANSCPWCLPHGINWPRFHHSWSSDTDFTLLVDLWTK